MAMMSLQDFVNPIVTSQDTKKRLQLGTDVLAFLENPINPIECEDTGVLIDGLVSWLKSSNFKVAQNGLETLIILAEKLKDEFRPYISTVLPATVDRLGDSKDQVRALAKSLLLKLMNPVASPQYIFEKLAPSFSHKNFRIRDEMMLLLKDTLIRHGSQSLSISKLMPQIVTLLGDPNSQVRDTAILTLVEIYKHVGEAVRKDLSKKYSIAGPKLQILLQKFDEVRNNGEVLPTATATDLGHRGGAMEVDSKSQPITRATVKRVSSAPPTRRNVFATPKPSTTTTSAGAADEEMFIRAFTDVPRIQLYSSKELEQELTKIRETLSDSNCDWEKRVEALKRVRSVLLAGGTEYDELYPNLRLLEPPFQLSVKDLRSQVVREACISIAYLAQQLGSKLDRFAESLLPHLINLIPNSAKIMSSAGTVAVRFIIQHTHVNRLIPIIAYNLSSKSKDIRKSCSEFLDQLLHTWPTHTLEKHVALLQDAIKKGISDADPEARAFSRKAYWGFADHFREQADSLLNSLDSSKQRMLQGELSMSNSSSNNSLNSAGRPFRSSASSHGGSTENLSSGRLLGGLTSGRGRSGIPVYNSKGEQIRPNPYTMRSNSAIDVGAVRRAKIRAGGMNPLLNLPRGSGASLPRMGIRKHSDNTVSAITSPERISRSRARGVSHSQPSSRSGSPSSRLSYATYQMQSPDGSTPGRVRRRSGIPTAGGASRDGSPTRMGFDRRLSSGSVHSRGGGDHVLSSAVSPVPILAERILPGNKEAEDAVADALVSNWHRLPARKRYNAFDDQSDESETSSVCSDRSFGSFGGRCVDDVADIIHCLKSVQWGDRKEGLLGLQALLRSNRMLTTPELKMITDIFTRLFMDPHMKVFTLFLDTLNELIIVHKGDLRGWLFPLITRILLKLGGDILPSLQSKIQQTLDLVRDSFPPEDQFKVITRFLNDQTQTPNQKVKIALLQYLHNLLQVMDSRDFSSNDADTKIAVSKIIAWTADPKGTDLKKPAQDVIVDLFNLNSPEFSILLNQMSKVFQDSAFRLLRRRNSSDSSSSLGGLKSPPSPVMSIHSPNTTLTRIRSRSGSSQNSSFEMDDTENQMPEDYYHSLRKTSAEIQKYSQDSLDQDIYGKEAVTVARKLQAELANSPQDGQNSVVDGKLDTLEERFEISSNDSSPIKRGMEYQNTRNAFNMQSLEEALYEAEMDIAEDFPISGSESKFRSIMIELNNHHVRNEQRQAALTQLLRLAKDGSETDWDEHFREVLRLLNDTIGDSDGTIRALALNVLSELMQRHTHRFHGFIEMTVLKILEAQKDADRDVVKAAETCSAVAATCLPPEHCVRTLKSIIMSDAYGYSIHQAAIKMITKVVEHPKNIVIQLLPDMMPALIQAYDHTESCVRKAAVFCMVDIYVKVGEVMKEHLVGLNSSKMKLLSVYIKRAQSNMSDGR